MKNGEILGCLVAGTGRQPRQRAGDLDVHIFLGNRHTVARTGSFHEAAVELRLSPSAVSHAIRKLEKNLGAALYSREGRKVRLCSDAEALVRHVGPAFDDLRRGMKLVSTRGPKVLRVHCAPSFAAQWLTPRLPGFLATHPDTGIRLPAGTDYTRFTNDEFGVDIVYGRPTQDSVIVLPLGEEVVTPLCMANLASLIRRPDDLLRHAPIDSDNKKCGGRIGLRPTDLLHLHRMA